MSKCRICGSYAINPGHHGRPDIDQHVDHDLCDVCFWRMRHDRLFVRMQAIDKLASETHLEPELAKVIDENFPELLV